MPPTQPRPSSLSPGGYRNPFGIRFSPENHPLRGRLFITENGEDERGARPTNNAPDRLQIAEPNPDGTPDFHGWPDAFGFLDSTQAIFNPSGGPGDDLPADLVRTLDVPVKHVLAFPPQEPKKPPAIEATDVATVGLDFAPSFLHPRRRQARRGSGLPRGRLRVLAGERHAERGARHSTGEF